VTRLCDELLQGAIDLHQRLLEQGITPEDIRTMVAENPARLLGVDERV